MISVLNREKAFTLIDQRRRELQKKNEENEKLFDETAEDWRKSELKGLASLLKER